LNALIQQTINGFMGQLLNFSLLIYGRMGDMSQLLNFSLLMYLKRVNGGYGVNGPNSERRLFYCCVWGELANGIYLLSGSTGELGLWVKQDNWKINTLAIRP